MGINFILKISEIIICIKGFVYVYICSLIEFFLFIGLIEI